MTVANLDVAGVDTLAAESEGAVQVGAECTTLHKYVFNYSVLYRAVGIHALAAFDTNTVIVAVEIAVAYNYIGANIKVYGVAWRSAYRFAGCCYTTVLDNYIVALIEVCGPEWRVAEGRAAKFHAVTSPQEYKSRTMHFKIGAWFFDFGTLGT